MDTEEQLQCVQGMCYVTFPSKEDYAMYMLRREENSCRHFSIYWFDKIKDA